MLQSELIDAVHDELGGRIRKRKVSAAVKAVFHEITESLARGERVEFRGFGNFHVKRGMERIGRNPRNGESVQIPEKHYPWFRTGRDMHKRLNPEHKG